MLIEMWVPRRSYHLVSRLAYVVGVGVALRRQDRHQIFTRRYGPKPDSNDSAARASMVMNNDALSFVVLCLVSRRTIEPFLALELSLAMGAS